VPYEYPQGRRVNVLAGYEPLGPAPRLDSLAFERTLTSDDVLAYLRALPAAGVPRVVVLDNASIHTSKAFKAQRQALADEGVYLYYLPPYSPKLNRIEPVFKVVKHYEMPTRSHATRAELRLAVEQGFASYASRLATKCDTQLRQVA
jgi:transposase